MIIRCDNFIRTIYHCRSWVFLRDAAAATLFCDITEEEITQICSNEKIDLCSKFEYIISKIGESPTKCGSSFPNRDPLYDIKKTFWNYMAFSRAKHFLLYDIKQLFLKNSRIPIVGHFWKCCYLTKLLVLVFYHDSICTDFKEFKHYRNILSSTNATL